MAKVDLKDEEVHIEFKISDEILGLHGSFTIPYRHIVRASSAPPPKEWFLVARVGTNIPGVMAAGTFFTGDGMVFYNFHHRDRSCLTLDLSHERYRHVVVEVDGDGAQDVAEEISRRLHGGPPR